MQEISTLQTHPKDILSVNYNDNISSYFSSFTIYNPTMSKIYFYVACTFGHYCKYQLSNGQKLPKYINAKQTVQINCKIKRTNQINSEKERIMISYGQEQLDSIFVRNKTKKIFFKLEFTDQFVEDQMIIDILKEDAKNLYEQGNNQKAKGQFQIAINLYQEAFQLYRPFIQSLIGMSQCQKKLGLLQQAIFRVETAGIINLTQQLKLQKVKTLFQLLKYNKIGISQIIKECQILLEKLNIQFKENDQNNQNNQEIINLKKELQKQRINQSQVIVNQYFNKICTQAIKNYHEFEEFFKSKSQLEQALNINSFKNRKKIQTPDYVLDPVTYEIMKQPLITPFGASYDKASLMGYFSKAGCKDPITRKDLNLAWIIPNHNLREFIFNNPDYVFWRQYEKQFIG